MTKRAGTALPAAGADGNPGIDWGGTVGGERMELAGNLRRSTHTARGLAAALLAVTLLGAPARLLAGHAGFNWTTVEAGAACYSCHTLDLTQGAGALNTSYINPSTRGGIFNLIKVANGGVTPTDLGCVFCHNNPSNTKMKGVLNHFLDPSWASKHPVGVNWNTAANTDHEYVSSVHASSHTTTELDCTDCHEAASIAVGGSYVNHPGTIPAGNPFLLKSVTVDGEYDAFCRLCHRSDTTVDVAGKGTKTIQLAAHADAGAGRPIVEADGTVLKPTAAGGNAQCTTCHDTHYSSKVKIFNDGHEGDTPIVGDNCVAVCHYPGDNVGYADDTTNNTYERHGHGKQTSTYKYQAGVVNFTTGTVKTMNMGCGSCHSSLDTGTTDGSRIVHVDNNPSGATNAEKYAKRYNLGLTIQDEGSGSAGGNPILGVCENCHASYEAHLAESGTVTSGCQDCHDEHAENSGPTSNVFMIPLSGKPTGTYAAGPPRPRAGAETVVYDTTRLDPANGNVRSDGSIDQYRTDGQGVCDNTECHGAVSNASQPGPLTTFFSGGYHALAGPQSPGTDCESCHKHEGGAAGTGSWGADPAGCASCHDYPGTAHVAGAHVLTTVHDKHAGTPAGYANSKGYGCALCHQGAQHNDAGSPGGGVANGSEWAAKVDPNVNARVQVRFDTTWNPAVGANPAATSADNTNFNDTTNVCSNTYCHALKGIVADPGAQGTATTPAWSGTLACSACHGDTTTLLTSNSHAAHFQTLTGAGAQCANCHTAYDLSQAGTHVDGTVTFVGALAYTGTAGDRLPSTGRGGCGTNYCHNNGTFVGAPLVPLYTWGTAINGTNSCTECHGATSSALTTVAHPTHNAAAYGPRTVCGDCHAAATVNSHADGTVTFKDAAGFATTTACDLCHSGSAATAKTEWPQAAGHWLGTTGGYCEHCHDASPAVVATAIGTGGASMTAPNAMGDGSVYGALVNGHGKTSGTYVSGNTAAAKACAKCHDASKAHINAVDGADLASARHNNSVNGINLTAATVVEQVCQACHQNGGADGGSLAVTHGNTNATFKGTSSHDGNAEDFAYRCDACHEPHGRTLNAASNANIYMVKRYVEV
ncbi:MAG: CxxxxCH/CxxCH domain-containing protein, partial [Deltaproteobacteria bacterium]|nr:CxxxxCH/CxxCH domain-containing protein [Deltaproteobacteria bacterium]